VVSAKWNKARFEDSKSPHYGHRINRLSNPIDKLAFGSNRSEIAAEVTKGLQAAQTYSINQHTSGCLVFSHVR